MRHLTTGVQSFPGQFSNENPFIGGQGTTISDITRELQNLDAEGKTVVITDPYLFPRNHKPQYRSELVGLLCGIKAAKYRYCSPRLDNHQLFHDVCNDLSAQGIVLERTNACIDSHDRFWYCPDNEKCMSVGTSPNGVGTKMFEIHTLTADDTAAIKRKLIADGVLQT